MKRHNKKRIRAHEDPVRWSASTLRCPCDTTLVLFDQTQWSPEEEDAVAHSKTKGEGPPFFSIDSLFLGPEFFNQGRTTNDQTPASAIKVAILDSGLKDEIRSEHEHEIEETMNMLDFTDDVTDALGHGTAVFAVIDGHVKNLAQYYIYKCIDDSTGYASTFSIACALKCALAEDVDVINMSFGSYHDNRILREIIEKELTEQVIITSQGNDQSTDPHYPSDYKFTYGMAGLEADWIEESPPGVPLWKCTNGYHERKNLLAAPCFITGTDGTTVPGTSFAAAFATGRFVKYLFGNPARTPYLAFKNYVVDDRYVLKAVHPKYLHALEKCVTVSIIK